MQQYYVQAGQVQWRSTDDLPANKLLIESPDDPEARNRTKRTTNWTGYTVHLTETCEPESPNLIPHVETTPATTDDGAMTQTIHEALAAKELLPSEHVVDMADVDAQHLVTSHTDHGIDLVGPVPADVSWQAQAGQGFDISCLAVDWEGERVICPTGHTSQSWRPRLDDYGNQVIEVRLARHVCGACASREQCTRSQTSPVHSQAEAKGTTSGACTRRGNVKQLMISKHAIAKGRV